MQSKDTPFPSLRPAADREGKDGHVQSNPSGTQWQSFRGRQGIQSSHSLIEIRLHGKLQLRELESGLLKLAQTYGLNGLAPPEGRLAIWQVPSELSSLLSVSTTWPILRKLEEYNKNISTHDLTTPLLLHFADHEHRLLWQLDRITYYPLLYSLISELILHYSAAMTGIQAIAGGDWGDIAPWIEEEEAGAAEFSPVNGAPDIPDTLPLRLSRPSARIGAEPSGLDEQARRVSCMLQPLLYRKLQKRAEAAELAMDELITAALSAVLHRHSGQQQYHFGWTDGVFGTTYVQSTVGGTDTLDSMALRQRTERMAARDWQKSNRQLKGLIAAADPKPDLRLVHIRAQAGGPDAFWQTEHLRWELYESISGMEPHLLDIRYIPSDSEMEIGFSHAASLEQERVEHIAAQLVNLLERYVEEPDRPLVQLAEVAAPYELQLAVASTFTSGLLEDSISFWMERLGIRSRISFAPYNQVFQQLLDDQSLLALNQEGINLIYLRLEDLFPYPASEPPEQQEVLARSHAEELWQSLATYQASNLAPCILFITPPSDQIQQDGDSIGWYEKLELHITKYINGFKSIYMQGYSDIAAVYPVGQVNDAYADALGHVPYTSEYYAVLGTWTARYLYPLLKRPSRLLVMECDNVLWTGSCSDGDELQAEAGRQQLQRLALDLHDQGVALGLYDPGLETDMIRSFTVLADSMLLRLQHLTTWRAGITSAASAVREMANEQGMRLDEVVYIGSNAAFCEEVRLSCADVEVVCIPADPTELESFVHHAWALDSRHYAAVERQ
ncbi:hypothetical protein [Paenibacillus sp. SYP-B4298]|uniref:hypothetical protein n=1 Tax=Paenibacillus sp. SYP-B4298 TaxID=2996034 RepID=UPI0022DD0449|nr:hypothetical protein [Paenibacillus sp. SYP-B4298]